MPVHVYLRLAFMMFVQYFIWGAWFVTLATFLGSKAMLFDGSQTAWCYAALPIGAVLSPLFVGIVADRFIATEKMLFVLHLLGAILLFGASKVDTWYPTAAPGAAAVVEADAGGEVEAVKGEGDAAAAQTPAKTQAGAGTTRFVLFFAILLLYGLCFMPTLALTNSISMHQMTDPEKQFPYVRVLGTIGWICAGITVGLLRLHPQGFRYLGLTAEKFRFAFQFDGFQWLSTGAEGTKLFHLPEAAAPLAASVEPTSFPIWLASIISALFALYCLVLPHTPPPQRGEKVTVRDVLGLDALALMKNRAFTLFIVGSFLISIPLQFYYTFTNAFLNAINFPSPAFSMTFGQMSEIFFLLVMPFFFVRLGVKWMLLIGMACWATRYFCFSTEAVPLVYLGIVLHGVCYDFFFVTGQIYVDKKAPRHLRSAAQGFIALVTLGLGGVVGTVLCGYTLDAFQKAGTDPAEYVWSSFWLVPAFFAGVVMILFALFFKDDVDQTIAVADGAGAPTPAVEPVPETGNPYDPPTQR